MVSYMILIIARIESNALAGLAITDGLNKRKKERYYENKMH